ncbi:unnamed protein product, partial [marine sediment metagenome]
MDAFPEIQTTVLEVGDYFSGTKVFEYNAEVETTDEGGYPIILHEDKFILSGNLVEIKIGPDFGIHTEPLERFQDELYRMRLWQQRNPQVDLHAVWATKEKPLEHARDLFNHNCYKYHIWGHIITGHYYQEELIVLLKGL